MNENFKEWAEVNQPFELHYQKTYNYRDFDIFERQWQDIFSKFNLHKDYFNNKVLLDIGCGSRPALRYFSTNNEKHCMEPLLYEFLSIERTPDTKFYIKTRWNDKKNLPNTKVSDWFSEEPYKFHFVPYETFVPQLQDKVDFILCWNVLDHGYDWELGINNMITYLKKGGLLLLGTDFEAHEYHLGIDNPDYLKEIVNKNFKIISSKKGIKKMWDRDYMILGQKL